MIDKPTLPDHVRIEVQRILDAAARRILDAELAEQPDGKSDEPAPGRETGVR